MREDNQGMGLALVHIKCNHMSNQTTDPNLTTTNKVMGWLSKQKYHADKNGNRAPSCLVVNHNAVSAFQLQWMNEWHYISLSRTIRTSVGNDNNKQHRRAGEEKNSWWNCPTNSKLFFVINFPKFVSMSKHIFQSVTYFFLFRQS